MNKISWILLTGLFLIASGIILPIRFRFSPAVNRPAPGNECPECKTILPQADYFRLLDPAKKIYAGYCQTPYSSMTPPCGFVYNSKNIVPAIQGYAGPIELLIGLGPDGIIQNVRCLSHAETSTYVEPLDRFLKQFSGRSRQDKIEPGQDIDAISGATITSNAIARIARESLAIVTAEVLKDTPPVKSSSENVKEKIRAAGLNPREARYWKEL